MLENYIPIVIKQDKLTIMKVIDLQIPKQIELPLHLVNSKNMTGINDIYRIILPTADIFPTLTATGGKVLFPVPFFCKKYHEILLQSFLVLVQQTVILTAQMYFLLQSRRLFILQKVIPD